MRTRETARVVVRDELDRVLLIQSADPRALSRYSWWLPGGGIEQGENPRSAAEREVMEETGLALTGLTVAGRHEIWMTYQGQEWLQLETIFAARVGQVAVRPAGRTGQDEAVHLAHHWWTRRELATTTDLVLPRRLPDVLDHIDRPVGGPLLLCDDSFRHRAEPV